MESWQMIGLALMAVGIVDALMAFFVIGPKIADEGRRRILTLSLVASGTIMLALGAAFWSGALR